MTPQKDTKHISLLITYQCNLNCSYCYESHKSAKVMAVDNAKQYIIHEVDVFRKEGKYKEMELSFMGGEPLMVFDRIKEIAEWWWQQKWEFPSVLFASTNGTLLTDDMKNWFGKHWNKFVLGLSFDGNETMQNLNRSESANLVDLDFFYSTWPNQPPKLTISPQSVNYLAEGIIYLHHKGWGEIMANLAYGIEWNDDAISTYASQLHILADYYVEHPQQQRCSLFNIDLTTALNYDGVMTKFCGCGEGTVLIDIDGKRYPCQMFAPITLSPAKSREILKKDFRDMNNFIVEKCRTCVLHNVCYRCYGINYLKYGDMKQQEDYLCRTFKVQYLTNCYMTQQLLERGFLKEREEELRLALEISDILFSSFNNKET